MRLAGLIACWMVKCILLVSAVGVLSRAGAGAGSAREFAAEVAQMEARHASLETNYSCTSLGPRPIDQTGPWDEESWLERQLYRWLSHNNRLLLAFNVADPERRVLDQEAPPSVVVVWDGEAWYERLPLRRIVRVMRRPPTALEFDCLPMFNLCDGPTVAAGRSLSDILATCDVLEQSIDGSQLRYLLAFDEERLYEVQLIFDRQPQLRLLSLRYDIKVPAGETLAGNVKTRIHYHVGAWAEYDGMLLPKVAYRDGYAFDHPIYEARGIAPQVSRTIFEREFARDRSNDPPSEGEFVPVFQSGDWVDDERANLRYKMGSDELSVDGFQYRLSDPIQEDPGPQLPRLIADSPTETPIPIANIRQFQPEQRRSFRRALTFGGIAFVASLVCLTIARRWAKRETT